MRRAICSLAILAGLGLPATTADAVVGGQDAPPDVYDAVASVEINGLFGCTGTLVAPNWILTAGHCSSITGAVGLATPIPTLPQAVSPTVGTTAASGEGGETLPVRRVVIPPQYLGLAAGYDVALLELGTSSRETPAPIAGEPRKAIWAPGTTLTVAGFGVTSEGGDAPATMQVAQVPRIADPSCASSYPDSYETDTQLCAGFAAGGVDTCQGDSGGPLFGSVGGALRVVGATSYGEGCARPGKPGVYARVADTTLREWIRSVAPTAIDDAGAATGTPGAGTGRGSLAPGGSGGSGSDTGARPDAATQAQQRGEIAGLAARSVRRNRLATRSVPLRVYANGPGRATVRLRVSRAIAREAGLRSRTLATRTVRVAAAGTRTVRVAVERSAARRLARTRAAGMVATLAFRGTDGATAQRLALVRLR